MEKIKAINELSNPEMVEHEKDYHFSVDTGLGGYWCSYRTLPKEVTYQTPLPSGIHLGAGLASIAISSESLGHYQSDLGTVTYLICPPSFKEKASTTLGKGRALSCGLYLPYAEPAELPEEIALFLETFSGAPTFQASSNVPPLTIEKLCAPIDPWFQGDAGQLIAESRAYELLACIMAAFLNPLIQLKAKPKHAIKARDIIEEDLMNSPSLQNLARQVGTNVRSLTKTFREVFGCSINSYLSQRRMEMSYQLLDSGLSVSETAYKVGYSLPYFSEKFQKRFGIAASHISQGVRPPKN